MSKIMFCLGSLSNGGAERVTVNLSNYLCEHGHQVSIITNKIEKQNMYTLNQKVSRYALDREDKHFKNVLLRTISRIMTQRKITRLETPDVVIAMINEPIARTLLSNLFYKKIRIIVAVRNDPVVLYSSLLQKILIHTLYLRADGFVFQTKEMANFFPARIRKKSIIIPNPIGEDFLATKPFTKRRQNTIVTVGRLVPQKNHKMLIEAFHLVHQEFPKYKLIIYGEGDLRNTLEKQICTLGLEDSVLLPGKTKHIKDKIIDARLFVLSSNHEGMPNALMEAMALGLPCISTDCPCGGPRFLIRHGKNGFLVPLGNSDAMARNIKTLLSDNDLSGRLGANARKVATSLSPDKIAQRWMNYIYRITR